MDKENIICSFCGTSDINIDYVEANDDVAICKSCVERCADILDFEMNHETKSKKN